MKNHFLLILTLIVAVGYFPTLARDKIKGKEIIKILILSGSNNHAWQETTPFLEDILHESGVFEVKVTNRPDTLTYQNLMRLDVLLSNWNSFPDNDMVWPRETEDGLLRFLNEGGGIVFFHASTSALYKWPEFKNISTGAWVENTWHGPPGRVKVVIENQKHPITKGLSDFETFDELWFNAGLNEKFQVLGSALNDSVLSGKLEKQPAISVSNFGKGRIFHTVLGHDVHAMKNIGFQTLLLRGAEWAATGKVTQELPVQMRVTDQKRGLSWMEGQSSLTLKNGGKVVWQYNYKKEEGKPYFHPLSTENGSVLSELRPVDHPWHRGIWFSWKYINGLNYWEENRETGQSEGITELKSVSVKKNRNFEAEFQMKLAYHPPNKEDVLKEDRLVTVSAPAKDGSYFINWESTFTALSDEVILDRTPLPHEPNGKSWGGYAGFSARLNNQLQVTRVINENGETEISGGNQSRWMTFEMRNQKKQLVSVTIFDHPENLHYSNKWYITIDPKTPFYYFSPAILYDSKLVLKKGEVLSLKYLLLVNTGIPGVAQLQSHWENFTNQNN